MKFKEVIIPVDSVRLHGILNIPPNSEALVIFSDCNGSNRFSQSNNYVAEILNSQNIATLLIDLLTNEEDQMFQNLFDINLLTHRLIAVTLYMQKNQNLTIGYFGGSSGVAPALKSAAFLPLAVKAVVSRGGRLDLADTDVKIVRAPTLLIVGSLDNQVFELNINTMTRLTCVKEMKIVEGASHLFEEENKLDEVATLAASWFQKHLSIPKLAEHEI